jgi:hypothetical protein
MPGGKFIGECRKVDLLNQAILYEYILALESTNKNTGRDYNKFFKSGMAGEEFL